MQFVGHRPYDCRPMNTWRENVQTHFSVFTNIATVDAILRCKSKPCICSQFMSTHAIPWQVGPSRESSINIGFNNQSAFTFCNLVWLVLLDVLMEGDCLYDIYTLPASIVPHPNPAMERCWRSDLMQKMWTTESSRKHLILSTAWKSLCSIPTQSEPFARHNFHADFEVVHIIHEEIIKIIFYMPSST